jgi:beta-lysine 5,6-aminomutase beta subunit
MASSGREDISEPDRTEVRPYGDTLDDGKLQMSFTLPVPYGPDAKEAARQLVADMGFEDSQLYHVEDLGEGYTFFIVYVVTDASVDFTDIDVPSVDAEQMSFDEINAFIREKFGRNIVIVGACTGTDAHSVGIDAIMNMKGYDGEYGLERYPMVDAHNLGMQVPNERLVGEAIERNADALLVSQVVTQKDAHITNLSALIDILEAENLRDDIVVVCGGPRIDHELALELGFDAGFGGGTTAADVASFVVQELDRRNLVTGRSGTASDT